MPTTSCVDTRLNQASGRVALPVRLVMPRLTIAWIFSGRGRKASTASCSCTMTTRELGRLGLVGNGWAARTSGLSQHRHALVTTHARDNVIALDSAFLDTSG